MTVLSFNIYYASVILYAFSIYHAQNYAGIIGQCLEELEESNEYNLFTLPSVSKSSLYTTIPVDDLITRYMYM